MATKKDNRTNNDPQNIAHKTKNQVTRTPQNERNLTYYIVDINSKWKNFTGSPFFYPCLRMASKTTTVCGNEPRGLITGYKNV